jgi:hypothetical protein
MFLRLLYGGRTNIVVVPTIAPPAALMLPESVMRLLDGSLRWTSDQWRRALMTTQDAYRRDRRAVSRALCDALLSHDGHLLRVWLVQDAVQTTLESLPVRLPAGGTGQAIELLEDAALALLARPALPLHDLAVLMGPCLPMRPGGE